jgi:hypothetical protein
MDSKSLIWSSTAWAATATDWDSPYSIRNDSNGEAFSSKEIIAKSSETWNPVLKLHTTFDKIEGNGMKDVVAPIGKMFYYPTSKPQTKEIVDALRSAEQNLDAFWNRVDKLFFIGSRTELFDLHRKGKRLTPERHQLQRTPDGLRKHHGSGLSQHPMICK